MTKDRTSISKAGSYEEIGEFWSKQDLAEFWDRTESAEFDVEIESARRYYPLDRDLSLELDKIARQRGVSTATLLNLWVKEKLSDKSGGKQTPA
jgi:hypothetical protein